MSKIVPVVLCGGNGTRLWPLSREALPKQFVDLGNGRTMLGETLKRSDFISNGATPLLVCNKEHKFFVNDVLDAHHMSATVLLEPVSKNTAAAIALAAIVALCKHEDPVLLVMPSDHKISDEAGFKKIVHKAVRLADNGNIVLFGVKPTRAEPGYGYICSSDPEKGAVNFAIDCNWKEVDRFVEKPSMEDASVLAKDERYLWNSGMFLMKASVYLDELKKYAPIIYDGCASALDNAQMDIDAYLPNYDYLIEARDESVDDAVMTHSRLTKVVEIKSDWIDLGSWQAMFAVGACDSSNNVKTGRVITNKSSGCYLHSTGRLITAVGVENMIVVETKDAVLVAPLELAQDVKRVVEDLKAAGRPEATTHHVVHRPWGSYETLADGERFQVKRIIVKPGEALSLQMHHHRAEHWVVVSGTAEVTTGSDVKLLTENESIYIPVGELHRLKNPGVLPLILIEIQSGAYLKEDDIVRFDDRYGRN